MTTTKYKIYLPQGMKTSLTNDAELFEFYKPNGAVNLNGFLKRVLVNYYEIYSMKRNTLHTNVVAEIVQATGVKCSIAEELASNIMDLCKTPYSEEQGKYEAITLTVSGKAKDILGIIEQNLKGMLSLSQYVRSFFLSYLAGSRSVRERIIFADQYYEILNAIKDKKELSFTTTTSRDCNYLVAPYAVTSSKEEQFNYLLCYDIEKLQVRSFRLSRIHRLLVHAKTYQIETNTLEMLKLAEKKSPQFAFKDSRRASVRLTEKGFRKYRMIYTNRPEMVEKNGNVLTFEWPLMQLEEYFKRFGKDAEIIEPSSAHSYMLSFYKEAYEQYLSKDK